MKPINKKFSTIVNIEQTVAQAHPALQSGSGSVFEIEVKDKRRLIVTQELDSNAAKEANTSEILFAIHKAVTDEHKQQVSAIFLLKPGSIPKMDNRELQRHICQAGLFAGSLNVVDSRISKDLGKGAIGNKESWHYWKKQLAGDLPILNLPIDYPRTPSPLKTFSQVSHTFQLSEELTQRIKMIGNNSGETLYTVLLSVFKILLYRYTNQEDIMVGSPMPGKEKTGLYNPVVLRTDFSGNPAFQAFLSHIGETVLMAQKYQNYPFHFLVEHLVPGRDTSRPPLFHTMFIFSQPRLFEVSLPLRIGNKKIETDLEKLCLKSLTLKQHMEQLDLTLAMVEEAGGISASLIYNADLFDEGTIICMEGHFRTLLESIVANPQQSILELPMLTAEEQDRVLVKWNNIQSYAQDKYIHQLFEEQAEKNSDKIALVFEEEKLTYKELNERANQVAHYLRNLGVETNTPVGIYVDRSLDMVVGMLGILKAGGAYVPIDPIYPRERIAFMLSDSRAKVLLTQKKLVAELPAHEATIVILDENREIISKESKLNPVGETNDKNLAYVIYTSGSTGRPKGVQVNHRSVAHLFEATFPVHHFHNSDVWTVFHSYAFDFSVWEIWGALLSGSRLVIVSSLTAQSPIEFY